MGQSRVPQLTFYNLIFHLLLHSLAGRRGQLWTTRWPQEDHLKTSRGPVRYDLWITWHLISTWGLLWYLGDHTTGETWPDSFWFLNICRWFSYWWTNVAAVCLNSPPGKGSLQSWDLADPVVRLDEKKRALLGNANNEPSEDSVTKIQKAVPCVKPRLDSPLHWTCQTWKGCYTATAVAYTAQTIFTPILPLSSEWLVSVLLGGKLHKVGLGALSEPRDGVRAPFLVWLQIPSKPSRLGSTWPWVVGMHLS